MSRDSIIVSVVVTCYNQAKFIKESINSILKQTYSNWECIIVDDGSVDNTGMIVNDYLSDIRIKYIYQQNSGVSAARNAGIAQSSGEYVQFLDGDDILEERKFELQVSFLEQNPIVDIVYGSTRYFYDGVFKKKYLLDSNGMIPTIEIHQYDQDQPWALVYRNLTTICAPLYRRSIFTAGHTFKNIIFEDWYFHLETAL
ncbi:MAG: glycosyltransferase family A protein, partial [Chitinophagaceae bacterium]